MFNALQLNSGFETFNDVAHSTGMAKTDWSWAGLLADFDNDGDRDAYIPMDIENMAQITIF